MTNFPQWLQFFLLISLGVGTGILSGIFGIGGGIVMVPALVLLFALPQNTAVGVSLVAMLLPVGALGVWNYYKTGLIQASHVQMGLLLGLGIFFGTFFGAKIAAQLGSQWLTRGFCLLLVFVAVRLWLKTT